MRNFRLSILFLIFISYQAKSQESTSKKDERDSYFKLDMNYLNDLVYLGRKDSIAVPYLTASVGYYHRSGFYLIGAISYLPSPSESRIDLFSLNAGYDFKINQFFSGSIYGEKYFYNQLSNSIKSDINGIIGGSITADIKAAQFGIESGISLASKTDFTSTLSISHLFTIGEEENSFSLNPTFNVYFSTLNFYEGLTNKKFGKKHLNNNPTYSSISSSTIASKQGFSLMNYEISLPLEYKKNNFVFYFTPSYAIPMNPITTTTNATITLRTGGTIKQQIDSTPWSERNLTPLFYFAAGLNYSF